LKALFVITDHRAIGPVGRSGSSVPIAVELELELRSSTDSRGSGGSGQGGANAGGSGCVEDGRTEIVKVREFRMCFELFLDFIIASSLHDTSVGVHGD
jgi:hypothetical protein